MLKIIIFCSFIALVFCAETRVKVGSKRWAFKIVTNEGKSVRKEHTDEKGVAFGTFSFIGNEGTPRHLQYKFDLNGEEPDISFDVLTDSDQNPKSDENPEKPENAKTPENVENTGNEENVTNDESLRNVAKRQIEEGLESNDTNKVKTTNSSAITISEPDYDSIDSKDEFSGHVSLKVGKTVYFINFLSGDKTAAREEALDENGLIYGKYTYFNEQKQSKIVVNYKFNSSGSDPTFEVSLYRKNEPNRANPEENESNPNTYYSPNSYNRVNRRILAPTQYSRQNRPMPSVTIQGTNPPHNVITPMQGNWYYRVQ